MKHGLNGIKLLHLIKFCFLVRIFLKLISSSRGDSYILLLTKHTLDYIAEYKVAGSKNLYSNNQFSPGD